MRLQGDNLFVTSLSFAQEPELENVINLRSIIGKHVYNQEEGERVTLVIE